MEEQLTVKYIMSPIDELLADLQVLGGIFKPHINHT